MSVCLAALLRCCFRPNSLCFKPAVVQGRGTAAYEVAAHIALKKYLETVKGRARLGIQVGTGPSFLLISPTFYFGFGT
jgi:hypothetical protein